MRGDEPPDRPLAGLGLRPADPGKDGAIDITAIGRLRAPGGTGPGSLTAEVTVTFHRGEVQRVALLLGALCGGRCPTNHVCGAAGSCVPARGGGPSVPATDAGRRDGRSADGNVAPRDASTEAGRDAGADGPRSPDTSGPPDAPPDAGGPAPDGPPPPPPPPAKLELGQPCQDSVMCASGFCTDGVCCNEVCEGVCRSCAGPSTGSQNGLCAPVADGLDPDDNCGVEAASSCGHVGVCDGRGACRNHPAGTMCGPATCDGATFNPAPACNGQGGCDPAPPDPCDLHRCAEAGCLRPCGADDQCTDGAWCDNGICRPKKRTGETCAENRECLFNRCVGLPDLKVCVAL